MPKKKNVKFSVKRYFEDLEQNNYQKMCKKIIEIKILEIKENAQNILFA